MRDYHHPQVRGCDRPSLRVKAHLSGSTPKQLILKCFICARSGFILPRSNAAVITLRELFYGARRCKDSWEHGYSSGKRVHRERAAGGSGTGRAAFLAPCSQTASEPARDGGLNLFHLLITGPFSLSTLLTEMQVFLVRYLMQDPL